MGIGEKIEYLNVYTEKAIVYHSYLNIFKNIIIYVNIYKTNVLHVGGGKTRNVIFT